MAGHGSQSLGLGFYQLIKCTSFQSTESPICVECQTWFEKGLKLSLEQPQTILTMPLNLYVCCVLSRQALNSNFLSVPSMAFLHLSQNTLMNFLSG